MFMQAPCNGISNLSKMARLENNREEVYWLAEESSRNTISVVEAALKDFPSLCKVIVMERLPHVGMIATTTAGISAAIIVIITAPKASLITTATTAAITNATTSAMTAAVTFVEDC